MSAASVISWMLARSPRPSAISRTAASTRACRVRALRRSSRVAPDHSIHSETGGLPGEHPGRSRNPLVKIAGLAWLEFEKPDLARAERFLVDFGFTVADRTPDALVLRGLPARLTPLDPGRPTGDLLEQALGGYAWPGGPPRTPLPVRGADVRRGRPGGPGPAGPRHGQPDHRAPRRPRRRPGRPERVPGPRGVRGSRAAGAAGARPVAAERRYPSGAGQRHPAPGPARGADPAARPRGVRHHPVPRRAGLVPGHPGHDRQRLPVPGRAARARAGDGVHPLRSRRRAIRPPHPRDGAAAADRVRALGLPAHRPRRGGGRGGVPARARVPPLVGHRPAHPGQPDLRLLARPGPADVRALHRRGRVRLLDAAGLGADVGQRAVPVGPEGDGVMSVNLARTAEGWWVQTPAGMVRLALPATTTGELLADRAALDAAVAAALAAGPAEARPIGSLDLLSPVTAPTRVVAQMVNYRSHAVDSGMDPDRVPPAFFRKTSHSITGPTADIIRPDGVEFLDYEIELGLVIGRDLLVGTTVTEADLPRYVAALVVTNDVSARQIQLTRTQFYEAKSYPTFTPVGPWLTLVDAADLARLDSLRLTLSVNGEVRQDRTVADMIVR